MTASAIADGDGGGSGAPATDSATRDTRIDNSGSAAQLPGNIDPALLYTMIDVINKFNLDYLPSRVDSGDACGSTVSTYSHGEYKATAYYATTLSRELSGRRLSHGFIYNRQIRGQSNSPIIFTADFRYVIKTVRKAEFATLLKNVPHFVEHHRNNPESVLVKFRGAYTMETEGASPLHFVLMDNTMAGFYERIYDLKGIGVIRTNRSGLLTERTWQGRANVDVEDPAALVRLIRTDADFLCSLGLMDYSIVLGAEPVREHPEFVLYRDGVSTPARLELPAGTYSVGIVDILTEYNAVKRMEYFFHLICWGGFRRSSVPPPEYRNRFMALVLSYCFSEESYNEEWD
ncbi:hypothetical protein PAPHI01_1045 [Pancytospora philotis]|nr:hypothetical protein PAPHI01_1045 [Pancytospora philotis]